MTSAGQAIPPGGCLVHIGFDKTGTTSLQAAFHDDRDRLRGLGVVYPGTERYHKSAGIAITAARGNTGDRTVTMDDWQALAAEVAGSADARVFVSSEWLCRATDEQARAVVAGLGGDRVHVVATIRPLAKILPSAWQQYVKDGFTGSYESWLRGMLIDEPFDKPTPWFWIRHRHDVVLARWAAVAGADNVTAVVVDETDHDLLLRQFEDLLGLSAGALVPSGRPVRNSSLSWPQAELLRAVNTAFRDNGWSDEDYGRYVRSGLSPRMAALDRSLTGPPIRTPRWALERAAEVGAKATAEIESLGVRVLGDLGSLGREPADDAPEVGTSPQPRLAPAVVAAAISGVLKAAAAEPKADEPRPLWRRLRSAPTREISALPEWY